MPSNWINHSISSTPEIKTSEDIANVAHWRIDEFYHRVHAQLLYGSGRSGGSLPAEIEERLCGCAPRDVSGILQEALIAGSVMDSGWLDDYNDIAEAISVYMRGYPKEYLAQRRALSDAAAGESSSHPRNKKAHTDSASKSSSKAPTKSFPFLSLPDEVRNHIYQLTLTPEPLIVSDWAIGSLPSTMLRRTEYDVPVSSTGDTRRTSYIVLSPQRHRLGTELSLLLASKQVHREASKILYGREFQFRGTADSILAFLHDHFRKLKMMSRISMRFTTGETIPFMGCAAVSSSSMTPPSTPRTSLLAWKKIFNILIRAASGLHDFQLMVDRKFWDQASWCEGPAAVFNDTALCQPRSLSKHSGNTENFLQHVAKLSGVNFRLSIAGADEDQAKRHFQRELEKYICEKMYKRPYMAVENISCTCRKRLLTEACAWDRQ